MVVDAKPAGEDGMDGSFVWHVHDFSKLKDRMHYSEHFIVGGYKW